MSKINVPHIFTSESVSEGHPDKVCDQISDAILDACLKDDPESRVACETLATTDLIVISGEITTKSKVNWQEVALDVVRKIGYVDANVGFSADNAKVMVAIHKQSPDISQGVTEGEGMFSEQGAGDQGMMFGYASNETPELMPATIHYSHRIVEELARRRHTEPAKYSYLRPDSKSQVSIAYENGKPVAVETVVVSHQHTPDMVREELEALVKEVVEQVIPAELRPREIKYFVNPTGKFEVGGPHGDTGLTGRKIIVDTYGGVGSHGGGAFSGKDPSKVDRSAAYMCRYIAKNIVAAGLADKCEIQVAYAIGVAEPLSINVATYGTGKLADDKLEKVVREVFDMRPAAIINTLQLKYPVRNGWSYQDTAAYGHFGRSCFPWEKTDKTAELQAAAGKFCCIMSAGFSVIGVGSPIVDLIAPVNDEFLKNVPGEKGGMVMIGNDDLKNLTALLGEENVKRTPGGSAGNTLFDLAHFGVKTALLGTAGKDAAGEFYKDELIKAGGSAHALRYSESSPTGHCICLVTPDAERTMRPALAAALEFDPAGVTEADFAGYTLAHLEGYLLAHSEEKLRYLMQTAKRAGCLISLDLASFEVVKAFRPAILKLLSEFVDIVFANSDEADALLGNIAPEEQLAELRKLCKVAVVKLGEKGAWADCGEGAVFIPANKVNAVDTTAAGDSFAAGFLYGLLAERDAAYCGKLGAALAAETVQVFGASLSDDAWTRVKQII